MYNSIYTTPIVKEYTVKTVCVMSHLKISVVRHAVRSGRGSGTGLYLSLVTLCKHSSLTKQALIGNIIVEILGCCR